VSKRKPVEASHLTVGRRNQSMGGHDDGGSDRAQQRPPTTRRHRHPISIVALPPGLPR
jgi:hypothetical protein